MLRRVRALVLAPLLLLLGGVALPTTASAAANANPIGHLDRFRQVPGGIEIAGWVVDPDTSGAVRLHIYANDVLVQAVTADDPRADIGARYPTLGPNHGFTTLVPLTTSPARVCVYAINRPAGSNPSLGCATFDQSPRGHLDIADRRPGGSTSTVRVAGWALDPDTLGSIPVHIYADGALIAGTLANASRGDIGAAYPQYGPLHGFDRSVLLTPGTHNVCAYAIDVGAGSNRHLGCRSINVSTLPFGVIDSISRSGANIAVAGWTIDPDTTAATTVEVRVDGALAGTLTAGIVRSTLGLYGLVYGTAHGYSGTVTSSGSGPALVCIYAVNLELGSGTRLLGCRTA